MGGMGANPFTGMGGMGGDQAAAMFQNPATQALLQRMLSDPDTMSQMAAMNPELGAAMQNPQVGGDEWLAGECVFAHVCMCVCVCVSVYVCV